MRRESDMKSHPLIWGRVSRLGRKVNSLYFLLLDIAKSDVFLSIEPWNCAYNSETLQSYVFSWVCERSRLKWFIEGKGYYYMIFDFCVAGRNLEKNQQHGQIFMDVFLSFKSIFCSVSKVICPWGINFMVLIRDLFSSSSS